MPEMHSVDAALIADMQNLNNPPAAAVDNTAIAVTPESKPVPEPQATEAAALPSDLPSNSQGEVIEQASNNEPEMKTSNNIDEYGNPITPPKMYTEEEVNRMMRERLSRGRHAEQPSTPQPQQSQPQLSSNDDDWQKQLDEYIDKRVETREKSLRERHWREQEARRQEEFEDKFSSGMSKYSDFREVVAGKPVPDGVMLAARSLENPAAFVYGAAKLHPQELERIAKIADPYAQALEAGRLHERMVKERRIASQAPKPIEPVKGDIAAKVMDNKPSLDQRILDYGQKKLGRR